MWDAKATENELRELTSVQLGPETKEYNLLRADEEYQNGNVTHSIYHQVQALFQCADLRFVTEAQNLENQQPNTTEILAEASSQEKLDYKNNKFLQNILKYHQKLEQRKPKQKPPKPLEHLDFLQDLPDAESGFARISHICQELPREWCVLQLCKSFNPATTYSTFCEIAAAKGDIYLSLLLHCRSPQLPATCLRFSSDALSDLFREYATLVERFRRVVTVDPVAVKTQEAKAKYWKELNAFEAYLKKLISDLTSIFTPYCSLFLGKRYDCDAVQQQTKVVYARVDELCVEHSWSDHQRILLSQAALHANRLPQSQMKQLGHELAHNDNETEALLVYELLKSCANEWQLLEQRQSVAMKRYPLILVVDERLDHLHWEQLAPMQECTRIKSLHNLWRLFKCHKSQIQHGYYTVNIRSGITLVNPDADLQKSGRRWRGFLEYWLTHWPHMFETVPSEQFMLEQAFKADCFVYAGHGSSLQYVSGRLIYRNRIKGVVFLFGCDSTRVLSSGLYSALYGAQDYFHGALCPTVVGTLMPALDANIDNVSAHLLSQWITPANPKIIPWTHIDRVAWLSQGIVQAQSGTTETLDQQPDYQMGSLSAILANLQMGRVEPKIYNCCVYVCRGLPAWNLAVQKLPF
ncbi:separin isoform X2 [Drosophila grimshawi]|uniref:separase n=1 Tax=Drosophila grimshawi TaxID=7222 RepID=B4J0F9_DROGR|nr:separin isoform X2 [Drosophila grimshawi]EDV96795.1 GH15013 [Drosophila grimshawi]